MCSLASTKSTNSKPKSDLGKYESPHLTIEIDSAIELRTEIDFVIEFAIDFAFEL